jgi:hypothetical protein
MYAIVALSERVTNKFFFFFLQLHLLRILFQDIFKAWNKEQLTPKDFCMSLTPARIKEFSNIFALNFTCTQEHCTDTAANRLNVLASEIDYLLSRSTNAEVTIRSLFSQFGFCLSIYIEEKLYEKIQLLADIIKKLALGFYLVQDLLYKELVIDRSNSILYKFAKALALFPFSKVPAGIRIIEEYPHIRNSNYIEIMAMAEKFNTYPSVIQEALHYKKTPDEAEPTVTSILDLFVCIGNYSLSSM